MKRFTSLSRFEFTPVKNCTTNKLENNSKHLNFNDSRGMCFQVPGQDQRNRLREDYAAHFVSPRSIGLACFSKIPSILTEF